MHLFRLLTPISYWLLIAMWAFIFSFYIRRLRASRLKGELFLTLILILSIDAFRTLFESIYFGAWYTSLVGFIPIQIHDFLIRPGNVFIPKFINVVAAALVIAILLRRWIPQEEEERQRQSNYTRRLEKQIAERNRLNQQLLELNELKDKFLGIAAHDLRNPLNVIQGGLNILSEGILGRLPEQQMEMVDDMEQECKAMLSLLNDLLDISAIESGHLELQLQDVPLSEYLQGCHRTHQILAQAKSIELKLAIEVELPVVHMDPNRIQQVINNLITNAIKFSHPETVVTMSAQVMGDEVAISIADEGQGIPAEELSKLFTDFGRTSVKPTSGESSTGLGLAIVKRIVEAHGGRIWVESEVCQGSTFTFALPIK